MALSPRIASTGWPTMTQVTVFGGTGFLGRRIVECLSREGATLRVAVRRPERVNTLAQSVTGGRAIPIAADVRDPSRVAAAIEGAEVVVNAVSAYVEKGGLTYTAVHVLGARNIATACQQKSVARSSIYRALAPILLPDPRISKREVLVSLPPRRRSHPRLSCAQA